MSERVESSREVERRALAARARLGPDSVEWTDSAESTIDESTDVVLSVDALPLAQLDLEVVLERWRAALGLDGELHLIERSRHKASPVLVSKIRSWFGNGATPFARDVISGVRAAGWTISAMDRFDIEQDGHRQPWVELRATDVIGQARRDSI